MGRALLRAFILQDIRRHVHREHATVAITVVIVLLPPVARVAGPASVRSGTRPLRGHGHGRWTLRIGRSETSATAELGEAEKRRAASGTRTYLVVQLICSPNLQ